MLDKVKHLFEKEGVRYWEYRQEDIARNSVTAWNGTIKDMVSSTKQGASFRVLYGNGWGFAHSPVQEMHVIAEKALALAKAMDKLKSEKKEIVHDKPIKKEISSNYKINPLDVSLEEKRDLALSASKLPEGIKNLRVIYTDALKKKFFANSDGSEIRQNLGYTYYGAEASSASGDRMESVYKAFGALRGYEITEDMMLKVNEACTIAKNLLTAGVPKGGKYPLIADGALTSVFIHEALGHASEADNLLADTTCLKGKENKKIGSSEVTVYDDATVEDSWGSFFYDDEGVPAHKTKIMDKGKFSGYLHSRETAGLIKSKLTGNARAESTSSIPLVRMSNTYIEPGDADFDEMLEEVKNGIYLRGSKGGQVDPIKGDFQFSAQDGFYIKNGELAGYLRAVSLMGNVLDLVKKIKMVEDKFEGGFPGHCGKNGQSVPVHGDNPSIFITKATVGGA